MANNRIYLRCKACGEKLFLGKHYAMGWYYENYDPEDGTLQEKLNRFYDAHVYCKGEPLECLDIVYETCPNEAVDTMEMLRIKLDEAKVPREMRILKVRADTAADMLAYYTGQEVEIVTKEEFDEAMTDGL